MTYRLLVIVVSPLFVAYTIWRACKDGGWRYFHERLGFYSTRPSHQCERWIHAASVGEVLTVLPLIKALPEYGASQILVTTNTPTSANVLQQQKLSLVEHAYLPIDFKGATKRFIRHFKPPSAWITETEIWPWLYARCHSTNKPITIVNGRLSSRTSSQSKGVLAGSFKHALQSVRILARSEKDNSAYQALGADAHNIETVGNLKYANTFSSVQVKRLLPHAYVVAASTHADEELQLAMQWLNTANDAVLVIVPRHPERGESIQKSLQAAGLSSVKRSSGGEISSQQRLYIADTLGELTDWFAYAKGAFVGGSLIPRGGHNMLEPARFACPTIVGRHTHNFDDMVTLMQNNEAIQIANNASEVAQFLHSTVVDSTSMAAMGARAKDFAHSSEDILPAYLKLLLEPVLQD